MKSQITGHIILLEMSLNSFSAPSELVILMYSGSQTSCAVILNLIEHTSPISLVKIVTFSFDPLGNPDSVNILFLLTPVAPINLINIGDLLPDAKSPLVFTSISYYILPAKSISSEHFLGHYNHSPQSKFHDLAPYPITIYVHLNESFPPFLNINLLGSPILAAVTFNLFCYPY